MARTATKYVCQQCGYAQIGWAGKCPNCSTWGSLVETIDPARTPKGKATNRVSGPVSLPVELSKVKGTGLIRISTGSEELDNVIGGGLVPGQVLLLAGEPGIGKSTLLAKVADKIYSGKPKRVIYVAGEESASQIQFRTKRLGIKGDGILILEETDVDQVVGLLGSLAPGSEKQSLIIVDSIQTLTTGDLTGVAGSVGQVRESAARLASFAKRYGIPLILVGHVTKDGTIAGPRVLEHMVDTVLWFEGDRSNMLRMIRAVKNRFGPTDEVGIFTMEERGLVAVENPSALFMSELKNVPGQVGTIIVEGTRPLVVEIQALVVPTKLPIPRHVVQGLDSKRVELLLAVLARRIGLPVYNFDVFVNVAGGIQIKEPGADLAVILAIASAFSDKPLGSVAACGEVGLLGEVRTVTQEARRIKEAKRLGFKMVVTHTTVKTAGDAVRRFVGQ